MSDIRSQVGYKENVIILLMRFGVFIFFVLGMTILKGYSIASILLAVIAFYFVASSYKQIDFSRSRGMVVIWVAYATVGIIVTALAGHSARDFEQPIRYLLAIPLLYLFIHYGVSRLFIMWCIGLAGVVLGAESLYDIYYLGAARAGLYPIRFGNIGMLMAMFALISLFFIPKDYARRRILIALLLLAVVCGMMASILSETRGGWLLVFTGIPVLAVCLSLQSKRAQRNIVAIVMGGMVSAIILYQIPSTDVQTRITQAVHEVSNYQPNSDSARTSVGARLEMWRLSWIMIQERPLMGWGTSGYKERLKDFVNAKETVPQVQHRHPHNELLNETVKKGVISTIILIFGLYLYPFIQFARRIRSTNDDIRFFAQLGMMVIVAWFTFGLVDVFLEFNHGVLYYLLYMSIFYGGMLHLERQNQTC